LFKIISKEVLNMPVITLEAGQMDKNQKDSLIAELTRVASDILKIPPDAFVVYLKENQYDNIGVGGEILRKGIKKQIKLGKG
jgi:4-oxalocrotonate tautomerase